MNKTNQSLSAHQLIAALAQRVRAGGDKVPSPCISVCRMSESTGWCEGCFRTIDEICQWSQSSEVAKRAMWAQIEQRAAQSAP